MDTPPPAKTSRRSKRPPKRVASETPATSPQAAPASPVTALAKTPAPATSEDADPLGRALTLHPHRISLPRASDLDATRLINTDVISLREATRRRVTPTPLTTLTIIASRAADARQLDSSDAIYYVGICVRRMDTLQFIAYPTQEALEDVLPHVLETAITYVPELSDVYLSTPHRSLWRADGHTPETSRYLRDHGINLSARHPLQGDVGATVARLASHNVTGPRMVDFHLYTASMTDDTRTYAGALLWGSGRAWIFTQTFDQPDLAAAEVALAEWAFKLLPERRTLLTHNANASFAQVWLHPDRVFRERPDLRQAMGGIGRQIRAKHLRLDPHAEPPHDVLIKGVRAIVANRYVNTDRTGKTRGERARAARR